jgi:hypothetical protein
MALTGAGPYLGWEDARPNHRAMMFHDLSHLPEEVHPPEHGDSHVEML